MSNLNVRGLSYIWKIESIKERTYKAKDNTEKTAYKINLVIEWSKIRLDTNSSLDLEVWKTYILPIGFRNFQYMDKSTWLTQNWQSFYIRDWLIEEVD